jgi:hypothetical protein
VSTNQPQTLPKIRETIKNQNSGKQKQGKRRIAKMQHKS